MFEMKFKKWPTSHILFSSIWKWRFIKTLIYHILMINIPKTPICDMIIIKIFTLLTNLFQSYGITMFNIYYKVHKNKIILIIFWVYLHFLVHNVIHVFTTNIFWNYTIWVGKKNSLWLNFLCYNLPHYSKKLKKCAPVLPWLKFKHGHPWKIVQCDNIFYPL